jgi:hypothetical protein
MRGSERYTRQTLRLPVSRELVHESAAARESTAPLSSTSLAVSRVRPTFIAHRTDDDSEDSEVAWDEYEALLQILADFSPGGQCWQCIVNFEGETFPASTRAQAAAQAGTQGILSPGHFPCKFHASALALHHALGPAARRASRNHVPVPMILTWLRVGTCRRAACATV